MGAIIWIESAPKVEIDGDGVKLTMASGEETFTHRMTRHSFRALIEYGRRQLDSADRAQQVIALGKVAPKRRRRQES